LTERALSDFDASTTSVDLQEETPSIKAFNEFLELYVDPFTSLSQEINPIVGEQAQSLSRAFKEQLKFIKAAAISAKPDFNNPANACLLSSFQEAIAAINDFKDANRRSEYFSHLNAIAEGTGVLSWFLTETPISFIPEIKDSATFWTNKVLKEFKDKDSNASEWVKQYLGIFDGLKLYVKQYHTTGLTYKQSGGDFATNLKSQDGSSSSSSDSSIPPASVAASAGGPPPPPPPPPANIFDDVKSASSVPSSGLDAVFSELNQGEGITKGLKKVDKSQMTHKNPELRQSSLVRVPSAGKKSPPVPKKPSSLSLKPKPEPVIELQDSKWIIKNVEGKHDIVLDGEMTQSVFIGDCKEVTVQIKGKVNAVSLSSTFKVALVVNSLISGIDVVNSKKFGIQVVDKVPQISVDKSDEGQIYLSKTSLETEVYTSSTTSLNINVPEEENGDFKEISIPEQFKHTFNSKGDISSTIVEHAG
jgi:adenylyl cyclase-associated protein